MNLTPRFLSAFQKMLLTKQKREEGGHILVFQRTIKYIMDLIKKSFIVLDL